MCRCPVHGRHPLAPLSAASGRPSDPIISKCPSSIPALRQRHGARPRPSALSRRHTQASRRHCCRTRKSVAHQYLSLQGGARWQGLLYLSQLAFPSPVSPPPPEPLEFKLNRLAPAGSALGFVVPGPRHPSACYCCCCCLFAMLLRHLCCPVSLYRPLEFVGKDEETGLGLFGWMAMRRDGPAGGQATKTVAAKDSGVTSPPRPCPTAFPSCGHPRTAKHEPSPRGAKYCPSRTLYLSCTPSSSLLACPPPLLPGGHRATPSPYDSRRQGHVAPHRMLADQLYFLTLPMHHPFACIIVTGPPPLVRPSPGFYASEAWLLAVIGQSLGSAGCAAFSLVFGRPVPACFPNPSEPSRKSSPAVTKPCRRAPRFPEPLTSHGMRRVGATVPRFATVRALMRLQDPHCTEQQSS